MLWAAAFAWWTLDGLLALANTYHMHMKNGTAVPWGRLLVTTAPAVWTWVPLTVAVFWVTRRYPIEAGRWRSVWVHFAAAACLVLVRAVFFFAANPWFGWYKEPPRFESVLIYSTNNLLKYWMFAGVAHALHYAWRNRQRAVAASRLEALLARAELDALRARLQPHFLFNALSALSELVHRDPDAAEQAIVRLAALLRRTLDAADPEVALDDELTFVSHYLEIERLRLGARLRVDWDIQPRVRGARVPHLVLQPLVENAVRHGLAPRAAAGWVRIAARAEGGELVLEVDDDGVGVAAAPAPASGLGIAHTRDRLHRLYGEGQRLEVTDRPGGGTRAAARLPLRLGAVPA